MDEDAKLALLDAPPKLEADVAVVAMSDKGITCPGLPAEGNERPSISGVEKDGPNVVIIVENLPAGRPVASGAVSFCEVPRRPAHPPRRKGMTRETG